MKKQEALHTHEMLAQVAQHINNEWEDKSLDLSPYLDARSTQANDIRAKKADHIESIKLLSYVTSQRLEDEPIEPEKIAQIMDNVEVEDLMETSEQATQASIQGFCESI